MNNLTELYLKLFTLIILLYGFFYGTAEVFSIMASYKVASELAYDTVCTEEFGDDYYFSSYQRGTINCKKVSDSKYTVERKVLLTIND